MVCLICVALLLDVGETAKSKKKKKTKKPKDKAQVPKRTAKDWSKMNESDFDKIAGDLMAEDLDSDDDFYEERMQQLGRAKELEKKKKKKSKGNPNQPGDLSSQIQFGPDGKPFFPGGFNLDEFQMNEKRGKPQLMFIKLKKEVYEAEGYDVKDLTTRWSALMSTAGIDCQMYDIEKDTVLVSLQKGQFTSGVKDFALLQPETAYFEQDSKKSFAEGVDPADYESPKPDTPPPTPGKKKSKKKKSKKSEL